MELNLSEIFKVYMEEEIPISIRLVGKPLVIKGIVSDVENDVLDLRLLEKTTTKKYTIISIPFDKILFYTEDLEYNL